LMVNIGPYLSAKVPKTLWGDCVPLKSER
jgi:hypothetical protein